MKAFLMGAFGDGENPSAGRLASVPTLLVVNILPFLLWAVLSAFSNKLIDYPSSVIAAQSAVTAPLLVYLNMHKRLEKSES